MNVDDANDQARFAEVFLPHLVKLRSEGRLETPLLTMSFAHRGINSRMFPDPNLSRDNNADIE